MLEISSIEFLNTKKIKIFHCFGTFQIQASTDKIGYPDIYERDADIDNIYQSVSEHQLNESVCLLVSIGI